MATSTHPISSTKNISFISTNSSSPRNFSRRPSQIFLNPNPSRAARRGDVIKIRCAAASSEGRENPADSSLSEAKLDRRNVLLGLGGLYGAYNIAGGSNPFALASPIPPPETKSCGPATISNSNGKPVPYSCCPSTLMDTASADYYKIPSFSKLNVRPAAHAIDDDYLEKYKTAIQKMKDLPSDDPRNFYQQANVHCAYCNGAYQLAGKPYQIHFTWLFFPFHRWYLYFYERILQSLIDDPTFTLPYWNWDNPQGMILPEIFDDDEESPLYDKKRNQAHRRGYVTDLAYAGQETSASDFQKVKNNLAIMYRQMLTNAPCPLLFFGKAIRKETGDTGPGMGTIENVPHNSIHRWVGDPRSPHNENMGNFYSAAIDPVFYCHHSNVDRMWTIWKTLGGNRKDITDPDWLQTEFLFYDETKTLVKVKVEDSLDNVKLGYTFQKMPTPWKDFKPTRKRRAKLRSKASVSASTSVLPATLNKITTFCVTRSPTSKTPGKEELLDLHLAFDDTQFIRFDVFVNEDDDVNTKELDRVEYAGSFSNLAHVHKDTSTTANSTIKTPTFSLAISELLEDLRLENDDKILVTLVPRAGGSFVTVNKAYTEIIDC
ncbi:PREDICTED: catechol oxidase B, chloroplastic-like [Ipomoea nil]|uniref:catechol oxidase B, chloroplastic-like n=1 Tax=Ipomoea nil TaxID=35883 RepID=UPI000900AEC8|nr:PREDICTED: catechol oxidase B, chloroplastic-like [Ipomoea nil]